MAVILTAAVIVQGLFIGCYGVYAGYHRLFVRAARERQMQNKNFITLKTGRYTGKTDFGYFDGEGTFRFRNGSVLKGTWDDNQLSGEGSLTAAGRGTYQGEFLDNEKSGEGTFKWKNGDVYTGQWSDDKMNGEGEYISGSVHYRGTFRNNAFYTGSCNFENDSGTYELTYQDGDVSNAKIFYNNGCIYTGDATDQQIDGTGTLTYASGDKYSGHFDNGYREGEGTYTWAGGEKYDGSWEEDAMDGKGTYTYANGSALDGTFDNNTFTEGTLSSKNKYGTYTYTIEDGEPTAVVIRLKDGTRYNGDMNKDGLNGSAKITYSNGDTYDGKIRNGLKSGQGEYDWKSGASYDGKWKNDEMNGTGTYTYSEEEKGYQLIGSFKDSKPDGSCQYYADEDTVYTTTWENGRCTKVEE